MVLDTPLRRSSGFALLPCPYQICPDPSLSVCYRQLYSPVYGRKIAVFLSRLFLRPVFREVRAAQPGSKGSPHSKWEVVFVIIAQRIQELVPWIVTLPVGNKYFYPPALHAVSHCQTHKQGTSARQILGPL